LLSAAQQLLHAGIASKRVNIKRLKYQKWKWIKTGYKKTVLAIY